MGRTPRIKFRHHYGRYNLFGSKLFMIGTQPIKVNHLLGIQCAQSQLVESGGSSLFGRFKIILISKKQNASNETRTHNVCVETQKDLHYAIRSLTVGVFNSNIKFLSLTETVIYFTIYDTLMLSRKLKISENKFLIDLDRKKYKTNFIWDFTDWK